MPLDKLGPYQLESLLGRGGMGAVYVGRHDETGERAAVKLLSGHLADDPTFRERFKLEIDTLKRLLHPNIVQLHGYGEEQGHLYYVMDLIEGRSLQDELTAGRRFHWREVTRMGIAIAQALKHAHDRGIIHRDLKPANLLIDAQDHVKLADFGIAKLYGGTSVTAEGGMLGTADYMAPEQASGKQVTHRCDLYSLGSVLFALLTGKPPFAAPTMIEVISALQNNPPVSVRNIAPETPEELDSIVLQLLEKDPHKRIATALVVSNRLRAMEHALSLDTRVMDDAEEVADNAPLLEKPLPPSKTEAINFGSRPTAPLVPGDDDEYQLAANDGIAHTDPGASRVSSRTSLSTQAGKVTGAPSDSNRGTDVASRGAPQPAAGAASSEKSRAEKISQFTTVTGEHLRGPREPDDAPHKQWALAGALAIAALAVLSAAVYWATRPPSANRLYSTVKAAAGLGNAVDLLPVEADMTRFLELYPSDPRADEVKTLASELDQYRLQQRLKPRKIAIAFAKAETPIERAYQGALRLVDIDPAAALDRFEALIAVFGDASEADPTETTRVAAQCIELARQQVAKLRPEVEKLAIDERAALQRQFDRAAQLAATNPPAARQIWQGIITLYNNKRWAKDLVDAAQLKLDHQPPDSTTSHEQH